MIYHISINKHTLYLLSALLMGLSATAQEVQRPSIRSYATSYAIVVDDSTYAVAKDELIAYKNAVESKGMGTYLVHAHWERPEAVKGVLQQLYKDDKLEGAVLVGDIPVPMIRDAQHLTSAFKMDQRVNWRRSSVASDRFYDDFDLVFEFLKRDSLQQDLYYYSLSAESPQQIEMDIYTARIKPSKGRDYHEKIRQFLRKASRHSRTKDTVDQMLVYTGHGYHSESLNAWAGEQLAMREHFPSLFHQGGRVDFLNFRMETLMRFPYLNAIQRPGLDIAIYHGHGSTDAQLLNGYPYASSPHPSIENIKRYLRSKIQARAEKNEDIDAAKQHYHNWLGVPVEWMDDALLDSVVYDDSVFSAHLDLHMSELEKASPQAKLLVLDACDNGAFYLADYLAAHYPFGPGENLATLANSVGVLQDIWPNALIGNLAFGLRMGNWLRQNASLESHLFGDPTFSFASSGPDDLNIALRFPEKHKAFWTRQAESAAPDIQSLALKQLYTLSGDQFSGRLLSIFKKSPYMTVRLQALMLLSDIDNADYLKALKLAVRDPYELTRRLAIYMAGDKGDESLLPELIYAYLHDRHSERVWSRINNVLPFFQPDSVLHEAGRQLDLANYLTDKAQSRKQLEETAERSRKRIEQDFMSLNTPQLSEKQKISTLRMLRAYRYHQAVPYVLELVANEAEAAPLRVLGLEVLGWYSKSYHKSAIRSTCLHVLQNSTEESIVRQAKKTLKIVQ